MAGYRLQSDRFLLLRTNDKGKIQSKRRFFKGDEVVGLSEEEVTRLLGIGAIVEVADSVTPEDALEAPEGSAEGTGDPGAPAEGDQEESEEEVDYQSLTYSDLQALARTKNLPATGSKDDLIARLSE